MPIDRKFQNSFINVTSRAALSSYFLIGKKDKIGADKAAVDTMRNELNKIEMFCLNKRNIKDEELQKLVCLSENKNISELIDYCLVKDEKNTINILNDNIFNNDDSILITRTFLNKLKKIHKLILSYEKNKNLNETIRNAKPPIFWKDKPIVEKQIRIWKPDLIEKLIIDINEIELQIKKNNTNSINLISDFILNTAA